METLLWRKYWIHVNMRIKWLKHNAIHVLFINWRISLFINIAIQYIFIKLKYLFEPNFFLNILVNDFSQQKYIQFVLMVTLKIGFLSHPGHYAPSVQVTILGAKPFILKYILARNERREDWIVKKSIGSLLPIKAR